MAIAWLLGERQTVPCSGVRPPSVWTPIIIRINNSTVSNSTEAGDIELVSTASFTDTVLLQ